MKKRLLSLLVAISMVLTFLPVSALTAAATANLKSDKTVILFWIISLTKQSTSMISTLVMAGLTMPMKIVKF